MLGQRRQRDDLDVGLLETVLEETLSERPLRLWPTGENQFRVLVLAEVENADRAFFDVLVNQTYRAYYVDPRVLSALGLEVRPPQPLGHSLPPFDPAQLDDVRRRGPIYRVVPSD